MSRYIWQIKFAVFANFVANASAILIESCSAVGDLNSCTLGKARGKYSNNIYSWWGQKHAFSDYHDSENTTKREDFSEGGKMK
jgi:hypothetical protein